VSTAAGLPKWPTHFVVFSVTVFLLVVLATPLSTGNASPASANEAASDFKLQCSSCHGQNGDGNTSLGKTLKAADLRSAEVQKQSDEQLAQVIANGRKNMPSFGNSLTQDQIRALVAYIRKLAGKAQR
jgi:mono/diheme cytochrome c family protein